MIALSISDRFEHLAVFAATANADTRVSNRKPGLNSCIDPRIDRKVPPSWKLADQVITAGVRGILFPSLRQMDLNALRYMGVEPDIAVEVDANGHEAAFIAAGVGISVTNSVVAKECAFFGLRFRPFEPSAICHYVVFWQRGGQLSGQLQLARERLADALRDPT
ncbi:hypothetical protein [Mesorhizobium sangaii]|uniref:LysR substrate-binding domain-containing protein n=1 Tax=Mesorhizobium sangaii TaxID=505389 RepID=A0A841PJM3_9HYPH|nr:hypothetical protein [Mesorhizobium sangaii]MBB6414211.1 hypothetical protein [Mesorhizobium sangaii]